jgi:glycosyltransferase involved in cell wall biosynthesis
VLLSALRQQFARDATDMALAPSSYLVERLRAHGWSDVRHQPYFIDFSPAPESLPRDDRQLLYVGRMEREKGIDTLIGAMPEILAAVPDARLTIVGDGSQRHALERLVRSTGVAESAQVLPGVARERLGDIYARASLCVLPSVWMENSPLVAYECLLSGLPMAVSRIGGIPELIEPDCGFTFRPRDPRDLAAGVIRFLGLSVGERERMGAAARTRAKAFDKETHLDRIEDLYQELRSRPARPAPSPSPFLPILERVGQDLRRLESQTPQTLLQRARAMARALGLPKLFP